jgi:hypothetical protein
MARLRRWSAVPAPLLVIRTVSERSSDAGRGRDPRDSRTGHVHHQSPADASRAREPTSSSMGSRLRSRNTSASTGTRPGTRACASAMRCRTRAPRSQRARPRARDHRRVGGSHGDIPAIGASAPVGEELGLKLDRHPTIGPVDDHCLRGHRRRLRRPGRAAARRDRARPRIRAPGTPRSPGWTARRRRRRRPRRRGRRRGALGADLPVRLPAAAATAHGAHRLRARRRPLRRLRTALRDRLTPARGATRRRVAYTAHDPHQLPRPRRGDGRPLALLPRAAHRPAPRRRPRQDVRLLPGRLRARRPHRPAPRRAEPLLPRPRRALRPRVPNSAARVPRARRHAGTVPFGENPPERA